MSATIFELIDADGCPDCHHQVPLYLGMSGIDNEGVNVAYRCPNCGMETFDYLVRVDDSLPERLAWVREPDGSITWFPNNMTNDGKVQR